MTLKEYLLAVNPLVNDGMAEAVLAERGIAVDAELADIEEKQRDLAKADVMMAVCLMPATTGGSEEQVGNWKQKQSGSTLTAANYLALRRFARRLYRKWDEPWDYPSVGGVQVNHRGMCI